MDARTRANRLASNIGLDLADAAPEGRDVLLADMRYAWDPAWLKELAKRPETVLVKDGHPILANVSNPASVLAAMENDAATGSLASFGTHGFAVWQYNTTAVNSQVYFSAS